VSTEEKVNPLVSAKPPRRSYVILSGKFAVRRTQAKHALSEVEGDPGVGNRQLSQRDSSSLRSSE